MFRDTCKSRTSDQSLDNKHFQAFEPEIAPLQQDERPTAIAHIGTLALLLFGSDLYSGITISMH